MKKLVPIDSTVRNPTKPRKNNPNISNQYLILIDGKYGWGRYSFVTDSWIVVEKFQNVITEIKETLVWFEEK